MHFGPTDAQERLRDRVRPLLDEVSPPAEVRRLMETDQGFDAGVWARLAVDHGLQGLHLPARLGGGGLGWVEQAVVLEEMGRVLLCAPYLATVTAASALLASDDPDTGPAGQALAAIAGGRAVATLAVAEKSGRWDEGGVWARAVASPSGQWRLEGEKSYVVDGCAADVLVVAARPEGGGHDGDEVRLFLVDGAAAGLDRRPLATVDRTRKQASVTLSATPASPLGGSLSFAVHLCSVALAAEQVGGAAQALDMAVAHARTRIQFGRPIGSFQAIQHLCAEMLLDLESARSAAFYAAVAASRAARRGGRHGGSDLPAAAAVAQSCCSEAFVRVATDSLHVHGGLGFTWDHDAHLYFRRARSSLQLFGDPRHHREELVQHLGL